MTAVAARERGRVVLNKIIFVAIGFTWFAVRVK
jgi:hypothetical protein